MGKLTRPGLGLLLILGLLLVLAPLFVDTYNTLNQRAFLDLWLRGNPYSLAGQTMLSFRGQSWALDWPYPPLTMLLVLPAWALYHLSASEEVYQVALKLPLIAAAVATALLLQRMTAREDPLGGGRALRAYLLNPGVILLAAVVGGFDGVAGLGILLAYGLFTRGRVGWSGLALGLAGALRLYPLLLAPVYLWHLRRGDAGNSRRAGAYLAGALAPLVLTCLPFLAWDAPGFLGTLAGRQRGFGPFSTMEAAVGVLGPLFRLAGRSFGTHGAGQVFLGLTVCALVAAGAWIVRRPGALLRDSLLLLLVFFLFYPTVHGLYTLAFLPLALLLPAGAAAWVWAPGVIWMLLVNGGFGATGLAYWLAPRTGAWIALVSDAQGRLLTTGLTALQALLLVLGIARLAPAAGRSPAPGGVLVAQGRPDA